MTLRDQIETDAINVFLQSDDFAETVIYRPRIFAQGDARTARTIKAIVIRQEVTTLAEDQDTVTPMFEVHVANSATLGISSEELDTGGDKIEFPPRDGKQAQARTITRLTTQDNGMLVFECR